MKNKKVQVKSIGTDDHGMPTINGKKVTTFRTLKKKTEIKESKNIKKTIQQAIEAKLRILGITPKEARKISISS